MPLTSIPGRPLNTEAPGRRPFAVLSALAVVFASLIAAPATTAHADATLATYSFSSTGWATFGLVLPQGQATDGARVGEWATQTDVKNRWGDGSIRYAIVTTRVQQTGDYAITASNAATGSFQPDVPDASLRLDIEGQGVWTSELPAAVSSDLWLDGPLVKEWRVSQFPVQNGTEHPYLSNVWDVRIYNDGTGTVDATVENVRDSIEADGVVYTVDIVVDGQNVFHRDAATPSSVPLLCVSDDGCPDTGGTYRVANHGLGNGSVIRVTSGPDAGKILALEAINDDEFGVWSYYGNSESGQSWEKVFYQPYGTRWHEVFPVGGFQAANVTIDFAPFIEAGAISDYLDSVSSEAASMETEASWEPLALGSMGIYLMGEGYHSWLGMLPSWAVRYIEHQSPELAAELFGNADLNGSYSIHFTVADGKNIVTIKDTGIPGAVTNPGYWLDARANQADRPLNMDGVLFYRYTSHAGTFDYLPYLVTGDRYYSDEMFFTANWALMAQWPGDPHWARSEGYLWADVQSRGKAWEIRDVTDAAYYLPDDNPYKQYFMDIMNGTFAAMDNYIRNDSASPLGLTVIGGHAEAEPQDNPNTPGIDETGLVGASMFGDILMAWAIDHAIIQGGTTAGALTRDTILSVAIGLLTHPDEYPPALTGPGIMIGTADPASPDYQEPGAVDYFDTWSEVWEATSA
ncbi:MAG: hypothetical protein LBR32_09560, partial [Propionibacteriaceae bacterium]|nr:hypothetical protein [Propionibacteriaceae bacterium]